MHPSLTLQRMRLLPDGYFCLQAFDSLSQSRKKLFSVRSSDNDVHYIFPLPNDTGSVVHQNIYYTFLMIGPQETIFIFLAILLLFCVSKLPELARSMGKSMGEFKRAQHETELEVQRLGAPVQEVKSIPQDIQKLAQELGIRTEGKDENKLLEEIRAGLKVRVEKG